MEAGETSHQCESKHIVGCFRVAYFKVHILYFCCSQNTSELLLLLHLMKGFGILRRQTPLRAAQLQCTAEHRQVWSVVHGTS